MSRPVANLGQDWAPIPEALLTDDVSANAVRIWGLLRRRGDEPDRCFPSHGLLAKQSRTSVPTVKRALIELEDRGWIDIIKRTGEDGKQASNNYATHMAPARLGAQVTGDLPQLKNDEGVEGPRSRVTYPPGHGRPTPQVTGDLLKRAMEPEPTNEKSLKRERETQDEPRQAVEARTGAQGWKQVQAAINVDGVDTFLRSGRHEMSDRTFRAAFEARRTIRFGTEVEAKREFIGAWSQVAS